MCVILNGLRGTLYQVCLNTIRNLGRFPALSDHKWCREGKVRTSACALIMCKRLAGDPIKGITVLTQEIRNRGDLLQGGTIQLTVLGD